MRMDKLVKTAKVALAAATFAIDRPYTYRVPDALAEKLVPGMRVLVPFGAGNRPSEGLVLSLADEVPEGRLKEIGTLLDPRPVLTQEGIRLALWMRERFSARSTPPPSPCCPPGCGMCCGRAMPSPPALTGRLWEAKTARSPKAKQIMGLLYAAGGQADLDQIKAIPDLKDPRATLRELEKAGLITRQTQAKRKVGDKTEPIARLTMDPAEAMALLAPKQKTSPMGYRVTELLCRLGSASVKELCYFTGASRTTIKSLAKKGVLALEEKEVFRRAMPETGEITPLSTLNDQQQAAYQGLLDLMEEPAPQAALLYGVTGSGKTQVYLHLIQKALEAGRGAIVHGPRDRPDAPAYCKSSWPISAGRSPSYTAACPRASAMTSGSASGTDDAKVVVGTRSAVFAPLPDLGLIILDEEQESSYQSESTVRYHAREVAKFRCKQHKGAAAPGLCHPSGGEPLRRRDGTISSLYLAAALQCASAAQGRAGGHEAGITGWKQLRLIRTAPDGAGGKPAAGRAEHPLSQPPGQQPHGPVQPVRRGPHLPALFCPPDVPQRQRAAHVPLLRLLHAPAGGLPPLRRAGSSSWAWAPKSSRRSCKPSIQT